MTIVVALLVAAGSEAPQAGAEPPPAPQVAPAARAAPSPKPDEPAWLGFFLGDAPDGGVKVIAVVDGGPAAKAGIHEGDLLLLLNDRPVTDRESLREAVGGLRPGERVVLEILRNGKVESREMKVEPRVIRLRVPSNTPRAVPPGARAEREARALVEAYGDGRGPGVSLASIPRELRLHYGAPADAGVLVTEVETESPAAEAGLKVGDVLVRAGGKPLLDPNDLEVQLALRAPAAPFSIDVVRGGKSLTASLADAHDAAERRNRAARMAEIEAEMATLTARIEALKREIERLGKTP
ncbi:MAG: PDZ domain-containing protein [Acidobacteriia bacterium]|nr:PDZ domain-containing protein [Terriglobia bacterium]